MSLSKASGTWKEFCPNPLVNNWVAQGAQIPFKSRPPTFHQKNYNLTPEHETYITAEISKLLQAGTIKETSSTYNTSPLGVVPKKNGKLRMILDLRRLNSFVSTPRFAMEDIRKVRPLLQAGDWMTSIDLKDASIKTEQYKAKYTFCFIFCLVLFFGGLKPPPFLPAQMASPMLLRKIFLAPLASRSSVKWQVGQRKVLFPPRLG